MTPLESIPLAALASVWLGVATLGLALTMLFRRSAFTDATVPLVLWLGAPGTMWLAGMVLWAYRKRPSSEPGIAPQRTQCKLAIGLAIAAAAIVYVLIIRADQVAPGLLD